MWNPPRLACNIVKGNAVIIHNPLYDVFSYRQASWKNFKHQGGLEKNTFGTFQCIASECE